MLGVALLPVPRIPRRPAHASTPTPAASHEAGRQQEYDIGEHDLREPDQPPQRFIGMPEVDRVPEPDGSSEREQDADQSREDGSRYEHAGTLLLAHRRAAIAVRRPTTPMRRDRLRSQRIGAGRWQFPALGAALLGMCMQLTS